MDFQRKTLFSGHVESTPAAQDRIPYEPRADQQAWRAPPVDPQALDRARESLYLWYWSLPEKQRQKIDREHAKVHGAPE